MEQNIFKIDGFHDIIMIIFDHLALVTVFDFLFVSKKCKSVAIKYPRLLAYITELAIAHGHLGILSWVHSKKIREANNILCHTINFKHANIFELATEINEKCGRDASGLLKGKALYNQRTNSNILIAIAIDIAVACGYMDVLLWLAANNFDMHGNHNLINIAYIAYHNRCFDILKWILENKFVVTFYPDIEKLIRDNDLEVLILMLTCSNRVYYFTPKKIKRIAYHVCITNQRLDILEWIIINDLIYSVPNIKKLISINNLEILKLIYDKCPKYFSTYKMNFLIVESIKNGRLGILKFLWKNNIIRIYESKLKYYCGIAKYYNKHKHHTFVKILKWLKDTCEHDPIMLK
jgi:hypothetical protein